MCDKLNSHYLSDDCNYGVGGLSEVWHTNRSNIATLTLDADGETVTALTLKQGAKLIKIGTTPNTAFLKDDLATPGSNIYMDHEVGFTVKRNNVGSIAGAKKFHLNHDNVFIVRRRASNTWHITGHMDDMKCISGSAGSGTAEGDESGRTFLFKGINLGHAPFVADSIVKGLQLSLDTVTPPAV